MGNGNYLHEPWKWYQAGSSGENTDNWDQTFGRKCLGCKERHKPEVFGESLYCPKCRETP